MAGEGREGGEEKRRVRGNETRRVGAKRDEGRVA